MCRVIATLITVLMFGCAGISSFDKHDEARWDKAKLSWVLTAIAARSSILACRAVGEDCPLDPDELELASAVLVTGDTIIENIDTRIASGDLDEASTEDLLRIAIENLITAASRLVPIIVAMNSDNN